MGSYEATMNKLAKWRSVFAGWQLGTRPIGDPESDAVRDHREATILLRAEVNAITAILIKKNICTIEELKKQMVEEAEFLTKMYEQKFPGMKATDAGIEIKFPEASNTMKGWRP